MAKKKEVIAKPVETKFVRVYECSEMISTWIYDYKKHPVIGLVSVETHYKNIPDPPKKKKYGKKVAKPNLV